MQAEMNEALAKDQLVSELVLRQSKLDAEQLAMRRDIAQEQLATRAEASRAQIAVAAIERRSGARRSAAEAAAARRTSACAPGSTGMLQLVPVDVGQQVAPGANLARVANPARLKAEIKIAETQAKDVQIGQSATVDTRNGDRARAT